MAVAGKPAGEGAVDPALERDPAEITTIALRKERQFMAALRATLSSLS